MLSEEYDWGLDPSIDVLLPRWLALPKPTYQETAAAILQPHTRKRLVELGIVMSMVDGAVLNACRLCPVERSSMHSIMRPSPLVGVTTARRACVATIIQATTALSS